MLRPKHPSAHAHSTSCIAARETARQRAFPAAAEAVHASQSRIEPREDPAGLAICKTKRDLFSGGKQTRNAQKV